MPSDLTPVFIRLPRTQAAALDRLASESGRAKQHVVSELVAHALTPVPRPMSMGRVEVSSTRPSEVRDDDVLTLDEVATFLKVSADAVGSRAEHGDLPARRFGDEWRFSRVAVLAWLADGDSRTARRSR